MPDDPIITAAEAAELLAVTDRTIRNWADTGRLPYIDLPSGQRRFRKSDIEAILTPVIAPTEATP